jgi:hypothetical protein
MKKEHMFIATAIFLMLAVLSTSAVLPNIGARSENEAKIQRGLEIAPVPLNLMGKDRDLVGFGSYLVNVTGCNDCHTHPNWATGGNPFLAEVAKINAAQYLAGGRIFSTLLGPIVSRNITPDQTGNPAGLTLAEFLSTMRTGHHPGDPPEALLKVMPWPLYRWDTDRDLTAMYEYLRAIPSLPNNPSPSS